MPYAEKLSSSGAFEQDSPVTEGNTSAEAFAMKTFKRGGVGALARSFERGLWEVPQLDQFMFKVFSRPRHKLEALRFDLLRATLPHFLFNLQSESRAFAVGKGHYDLGNDLFKAMLDPSMTYTCGYWRNAGNLEQAQEAKLRLSCEKLGLQPGMRVLDVGCGWGNFAEFATRHYGVSVVGLTVSKEQAAYAKARCTGLEVEILLQDYRQQTGSFDRVVSLEMIEAVGRKNMKSFFSWVAQRLNPRGLFLLQAISADTMSRTSPVSLDEFFVWIERSIFPNGYLPTLSELTSVSHSKLVVSHLEEFGTSYDRTLCAWAKNFELGWSGIEKRYGMEFKRRWWFYLNSCAALFRIRDVQLYQVLYSKDR